MVRLPLAARFTVVEPAHQWGRWKSTALRWGGGRLSPGASEVVALREVVSLRLAAVGLEDAVAQLG